MNLTTERVKQILDGAPEGATHVEIVEYSDKPETLEFLVHRDGCWYERDRGSWVEDSSGRICCYADIRSLSDLREILTLRQRINELELAVCALAAADETGYMGGESFEEYVERVKRGES